MCGLTSSVVRWPLGYMRVSLMQSIHAIEPGQTFVKAVHPAPMIKDLRPRDTIFACNSYTSRCSIFDACERESVVQRKLESSGLSNEYRLCQ